MKKKFVISVFFLLVAVVSKAQTIDEHARTPAKSPIEGGDSRKQKEAEKKKLKQKEELDEAIDKGRKQHMSYQEKATRKRMKKSKKKAKDWNHR